MASTRKPTPRAVEALIQLMADVDDEVRNWATFDIGVLEADWKPVDSPEIRDALAARLIDSFDEVRCEAMMGLAARKDRRAVEPIMAELTGGNATTGAFEGAKSFASPEFYPALLALRKKVDDPDNYWVRCLDDALAACKPLET